MAREALATAWIQLQPSFKGLKQDIAKEVGGVPTDQLGRSAGNRYVSGVKGTLKGVGAALAGAFAVNKIISGMTDAINAASDLQEAGTAVQEIFGGSYSEIEKWSKNAARALGQSQIEALNAAKTFGVYGQSAGLAGQANVEFSTTMAELATDLASFHNTSPEEAVLALGAALRGENEPLRRYGVLIDDATMRQKALALGLISTTKDALTPQQKVLAAQALIMEQTAVAQGDFERTSESLANKQRILNAEWENFSAELGEVMLPAISDMVTGLNDDLIPALKDMLTALKSLQEEEWFAKLNEELGSGGSLDLATGGFFDTLETRWGQLPQSFANGWEQIKSISNTASDSIEVEFVAWLGRIGKNLDNGRQQINQGVTWLWDQIAARFSNGWSQISTWWTSGWDGLGRKLENGRQQINTGVMLLVDGMSAKFRNGWSQITGAFSNGWEQIKKFMGWVGGVVDGAKKKFEAAGRGIRDAFRGIGQFLKDAFKPITDLMGGVGNAFKTFFGGAGDRARHIKGMAATMGGSGTGSGGPALARVRSSMPSGLRVTDTLSNPVRDRALGLKRSPNSYHYDAKNPAVDIAGPTWLLHQYAKKLRAMGGWRQLLWQVPGHYDHIHVAHTGGVVQSSWYRSPGDKWDERTVRLQVGETVLPKGVSPVNASYEVAPGGRPIYVQNPWGPEYMEAKVSEVADERIGAYDGARARRGVLGYGGPV